MVPMSHGASRALHTCMALQCLTLAQRIRLEPSMIPMHMPVLMPACSNLALRWPRQGPHVLHTQTEVLETEGRAVVAPGSWGLLQRCAAACGVGAAAVKHDAPAYVTAGWECAVVFAVLHSPVHVEVSKVVCVLESCGRFGV